MLIAADLFCGIGGISAGFEEAGWDIAAGNDQCSQATQTYSLNFPRARTLTASIESLEAQHLLSARGLGAGDIDCLVGGPPCQAFSVNNHKRSSEDYRAGLVHHYLRLVADLSPKAVLIENVPGMLSVNGDTIGNIVGALGNLGYAAYPIQLCASDFGVPQTRKRLLILASNSFDPKTVWANLVGPKPEIRRTSSGVEYWRPKTREHVTVSDALGDLPNLENGHQFGDFEYSSQTNLSAYQIRARRGSERVRNHACSRLGQRNLMRLRHIPQGGNWRSIPEDLLPAGMKRARKSDHTKRYGRLATNGLSGTILTKCDPHWGAYFHPSQDRVLSVREAARLQSFRDAFVMANTGLTAQYRGIGNAVPPLLATKIAASIQEIRAAP